MNTEIILTEPICILKSSTGVSMFFGCLFLLAVVLLIIRIEESKRLKKRIGFLNRRLERRKHGT